MEQLPDMGGPPNLLSTFLFSFSPKKKSRKNSVLVLILHIIKTSSVLPFVANAQSKSTKWILSDSVPPHNSDPNLSGKLQ